jgi:hypothetical protein
MTKTLRVNPDRMLESFNRLALIGATADGGVHRPTLQRGASRRAQMVPRGDSTLRA